MSKRPRRNTRPLVLGYLERIASSAFSEFPKQITDLVHGRHGVYALYKGDRLYYVGLATNLRNRIKHHLRDKHAGKWNRFSLFLVRRAEHIKELESLIIRIADPTGNATRGALPGAENLWGTLHASIRVELDRKVRELLGPTRKRGVRRKPTVRASRLRKAAAGREPPLAPYVTKRFEIRRLYKGTMHIATVLADGRIRYAGKLYNSPSLAGAAVMRRRPCSGWMFWSYRDASGNWAKLSALKQKQRE